MSRCDAGRLPDARLGAAEENATQKQQAARELRGGGGVGKHGECAGSDRR